MALQNNGFCVVKAALLQCKTAAFASHLGYINKLRPYIGRKDYPRYCFVKEKRIGDKLQ